MVAVCELEEKDDDDGPSDAGKGFFEASIAIALMLLDMHEYSGLKIPIRFRSSRSELVSE